jgi:hypothetical protein
MIQLPPALIDFFFDDFSDQMDHLIAIIVLALIFRLPMFDVPIHNLFTSEHLIEDVAGTVDVADFVVGLALLVLWGRVVGSADPL